MSLVVVNIVVTASPSTSTGCFDLCLNAFPNYRTRLRSLFSKQCLPLSLTHSLTDGLTNSCLVNLIDVTLACEDAYSKLVEVVPVADVSDEVMINFCSNFERFG